MTAELEIDIAVNHDDWLKEAKDLNTLIAQTISKAFEMSQIQFNSDIIGEVSVVLADDRFVQGLNLEYREKDKPTNVLSFPQTETSALQDMSGIVPFGDIIIAYETVKNEADEQNKSFIDHFTHLLVHGTLHLLGYDHQIENEAEQMESLEIEILKQMGIENPYSDINFMA